MQLSLDEALLVSVFRAARSGKRANLTLFCRRRGASVEQLAKALARLEGRRLLSLERSGERLTLEGLAVAAALSSRLRRLQRPLAACRSLAA